MIGLIGVVVVYGVLVYPKFGIAVLLIAGYLLSIPLNLVV